MPQPSVPPSDPIRELAAGARTFGAEAARRKALLLTRVLALPRVGVRDLTVLLDTVCWLLAYPDDRAVHRLTRQVADRIRTWAGARAGGIRAFTNTGFPGGANRYVFSLPTIVELQRRFADCLDVDWEVFESTDDATLQNTLGLLVAPAERQGLDSIQLSMAEWVEMARAPGATSLAFLVAIFTGAGLDVAIAEQLWEVCAIPVRYLLRAPGTARCETIHPVDRVHYQRDVVRDERLPLAPQIRRPAAVRGPLSATAGRALIGTGCAALASRNLEIRTLMHANDRDVHVVDCGRGVQVVLVGVVPGYRDPLEAHYCCFVLKNGLAMAYGPASVHFGCCEMGLNLFPEFRGAEIRWIYPQYMRAIHQVLGARYFFLTPYGMGEGNPDAIRSGAFWFYRKLGFLAENPDVDRLAREEELRMRTEPGHRSDRRMLHRLSGTRAYFDLSGGACRPWDLAEIGVRVSRFVVDAFDGDRRRAEEACARRIATWLGTKRDRASRDRPTRAGAEHGFERALRLLAPILCALPGVDGWTARDRRAMADIVRAKGSDSEADVDRRMSSHEAFRDALRSWIGTHSS